MRWIAFLLPLLILAACASASPIGDSSGGPPDPPAKSGLDKANLPSYDGADISGFARFLAEEDSANCTKAYVSRVRRFASDTFAYQPLVYPGDTEEFIGHLKRHCAAEGTPIR